MARVEVTTWSLEMRDAADLKPARAPAVAVSIERAEVPQPELNRFLYTAVGGNWYWLGRLPWTYERWMAWLDRAEVETWVARCAGSPAGYFELERQEGGDVEIAYFGLLPQYIGKGIGGHLLTSTIQRAWALDGTRRVWVHTCSLDHPSALANYQARGLEVFEVETEAHDLPDQPPGPWPGANSRPRGTGGSRLDR
jgi:GNAT superfamily N-acetyltransferase